ncbi:DNA-directed RNA polymerase subunit beta' [Candidatus Kuenenbacteria bacterium HGW-Kuenenbacteria-1]|uniref:DNA-directed RNA polymerase subunit beta' n=1 Tax=Candidatus Kuenenbacteria bacterium HGW-Kuenenbacteria-1 TaxID=2013812 RepID=A0A2N1UND3_9BACT|nr:MAG: DNA-directed RNA polymerase subunit beta' [Candidatus Kuenenbacteria bacterium HGW-Kuenenbacteria-1]
MSINFFDFNAIKLKVASPEDILNWSFGEVTKPETINYRTQKPERDGLFCEKIFGPVKDWECACGKYRRIRYKGIICDKCGVEVAKNVIRRERMGHIKLVAPVSHIWFLRGVPSKIGLLLDMSVQNLEKIVYFAGFIVTEVKEELKNDILKQVEDEFKIISSDLKLEFDKQVDEIKKDITQKLNQEKKEKTEIKKELVKEIKFSQQTFAEKFKKVKEALKTTKEEVANIRLAKVLSKNEYQNLSSKYGNIFEVGIGAEAIHKLLSGLDLEKLIIILEKELLESDSTKKEKIICRLKLIKNLIINKIKPEWMILTVVPVLPPDLRPMVQLDGGRFASSDLNDLYRRIINRNNRLKRLIELNAPEVICRNEKRMLQEAVDSLIDNSVRHGKTVIASTGQKRNLKSIADMLKGKQGRFRQNLLGKRVDYSGRSVIVVGPNLKLHQCGIPKTMALELFKPFVISKLIKQEYAHNVRSAGYLIEEGKKEVWDILEGITNESYVLLNRAPTLHRLGIQAFKPILIEGKAIQIHPMVCAAFNADFDGDQMAVHVPLTVEAKNEAKELMLSSKNLLKPSTGDPIAVPTQDMIVGSFYLTYIKKLDRDTSSRKIKVFSSKNEALLAYDLKKISIQEVIKVRTEQGIIEMTPGKIIFNSVLPVELKDYNTFFDKKAVVQLVKKSLFLFKEEKTAILLDKIKEITLKHLTQAGFSWGIDELPDLPEKHKIIKLAENKISEIQNQFNEALLTEEERYNKIIEIWTETKDEIIQMCKNILDEKSSAYYMIESGARGSITQTTQMMGMKGLVVNPKGDIIELPIKSSFKEGFDTLEYFISSHGARKGLSDTALRTASAGYLTRRLVDVAQGVIITEEDCGDEEGIVLMKEASEKIGETLAKRVLGRVILENIIDPKTKKILIKKGTLISFKEVKILEELDLKQIKIRSVIGCRSLSGICQKCYGWDLGYNRLATMGTAVGVIAAESIGEPGTQLTMRTFHTGGVAGQDITQGLPRVGEVFEARLTKRKAFISEVDGKIIKIIEEGKEKKVLIKHEGLTEDTYKIKDEKILVKNGQEIKKGDVLFKQGKKEKEVVVLKNGKVKILKGKIKVIFSEEKIKEYLIPIGYILKVHEGELITKGDALTEGNLDLEELFRFKGKRVAQRYILEEIQYIYSSQGQKVSDKHMEIIIRQMFSKVLVQDPGESDFLKGEIISQTFLKKINEKLIKEKKNIIKGKELFLGITKVSLLTESWLSAASFQETARVLIDAAVSGRVDELTGLKENIIIGHLIPAGTGYKKS